MHLTFGKKSLLVMVFFEEVIVRKNYSHKSIFFIGDFIERYTPHCVEKQKLFIFLWPSSGLSHSI